MKVSIILPTFNEADNIIELVEKIIINIPSGWDYEIIVVDDNSPDGTYEKVKTFFQKNDSVFSILRTLDKGFAKSIRAGIENATGESVIVMDTDFTHDPVEIPKLLHVGKIYDIVSGSRFCPGGNMQDFKHYIFSFVFNLFLRLSIRTQIQDNLGGYFIAKTDKLRGLPYDKIFYGYGDYFFRLLHYAQQEGMTIVEIPAKYIGRNKGHSKSNYLKMFFSYTKEIVRLNFK